MFTLLKLPLLKPPGSSSFGLSFSLGIKLTKQLSPCLIVYISIFDPKCYSLIFLFEILLLLSLRNDSTVQKSRPMSQEVFPVLRLFFANIKYYLNLAKETVLKVSKIMPREFKTIIIAQLQPQWNKQYIVFRYG